MHPVVCFVLQAVGSPAAAVVVLKVEAVDTPVTVVPIGIQWMHSILVRDR